tara:strand:+ start:158 stop:397 length:240 start_codon:yes stop_codon:yes gene_type:complete
MNIISVEVAEFKANFDFIMSLVSKGHTVKINTGDKVAIITSVAQAPPEINIPQPEEFVPDPAGTQAFVSESLGQMTKDF